MVSFVITAIATMGLTLYCVIAGVCVYTFPQASEQLILKVDRLTTMNT